MSSEPCGRELRVRACTAAKHLVCRRLQKTRSAQTNQLPVRRTRRGGRAGTYLSACQHHCHHIPDKLHISDSHALTVCIWKIKSIFLDFLSPMVMLFIASIRFRALSEITQEHKHTMFFNLKRIKSALMRLAVSAVVIYSPLLMFGNTVIRISYYCYSFKPIEPGNDVEFQLWFSLVFGCIMCILLTIVSGLMLRVCFKPRPIEDILDLDIPCSQKDMRNTSYVIISIVFCNIITFILHSINIFSILDGLHSFSLTNSSEISIINTHNICTIYCANSAANIFLHCGREKFSKTLKQMLCSCRKVEKQQRLMQDH